MGKKRIKKRRRSRPASISKKKNLSQGLVSVNYDISYEPLETKEYPEEVDKQMEELYALMHSDPRKAIPRLMELKGKYPNVPELYNWLAASQGRTGDIPAYEATTLENYQKNPDYLFAKLNYADVCINQGKLNEIPVIFEKKFELSLLYPERKTFHITEVVGFFGIMGIYHSEMRNKEAATVCLDLLKQIAPEHETTKKLMFRFGTSFLGDYINVLK